MGIHGSTRWRWRSVIIVASLMLSGCGDGDPVAQPVMSTSAPAGPVPTETASSTTDLPNAEYLQNFEFVWTTINERYFDPDFGGVDWEAVHDEYLPQVTAAQSDLEVLYLLNLMLWELDVSHIGVVPPEDPSQMNPELMSEGELGIDIRLLDGEYVITDIEAGSPGAEAGLQPGYLLEIIGGRNIEDIVAEVPTIPPGHERGVRSGRTTVVRAHLYGQPGEAVTIGYRDSSDHAQDATLIFQQREPSPGAEPLAPGVPVAFTTLEVGRLEGDIGYMRFDAFGPGMLPALLEAVDSIQDAPGLIIDLRGNHGGTFTVRKPLVDRLVDEPVLLWTYRWRDSREDVYVEPASVTYDGPIVVLVDVLSASSAEEFTGGLQAIGRAVVIGERTAGRVLVQEIAELPNGAIMVYPKGQSLLSDGLVLEGHGVIPDIPVAVHRSDLLAGVDPTMRSAIDQLQEMIP